MCYLLLQTLSLQLFRIFFIFLPKRKTFWTGPVEQTGLCTPAQSPHLQSNQPFSLKHLCSALSRRRLGSLLFTASGAGDVSPVVLSWLRQLCVQPLVIQATGCVIPAYCSKPLPLWQYPALSALVLLSCCWMLVQDSVQCFHIPSTRHYPREKLLTFPWAVATAREVSYQCGLKRLSPSWRHLRWWWQGKAEAVLQPFLSHSRHYVCSEEGLLLLGGGAALSILGCYSFPQ